MSNQIVISSGAKVRSLEGVLTGTAGVVNALGINVPSGIPQLDGSGKILVSQLPNSVMEYKGTWNAATNTPTLADGTGNQGDVYLCNVAGTVNFGSGPIAFFVGDQVIYSGSIWQRASGATGTVTSVAVTETGDALTITGSPITTSGTINIGFAGTSGQYVNGAGGLTTFPSLTGYVPYTGATADVNLGLFDLKTAKVWLYDNPNSGYGSMELTDGVLHFEDADGHSMVTMEDGYLTIANASTIRALLNVSALSANRDYAFPNASGTLALTSDLSGFISGSGTTNYIPKFTASGTIGNSIITDSGTTAQVNGSLTVSGPLLVNPSSGFPQATIISTGSTQLRIQASTTSFNSELFFCASPSTYGLLQYNNANNYFTLFANSTAYARLFSNGNFAIGTTLANNGFKLEVEGTSKISGQLTLGSTITNGTYTYTLPSATGTLALTSDIPSLTGYVTLATTQTISGAKTFSSTLVGTSASFLNGSGTGLDVASDLVIFRASTGFGSPRQITLAAGNGPTTYLEAKGYGGNYITDFGIRTYNSSGTAFEVFFATSAGNVGIGTTTPDSQLVINGASNSRFNMRAGNTRYGTLYADSGVFAMATITSIPLVFGINDVEKMRISTGGNVGIGTGSPSCLLHLQKSGGTGTILQRIQNESVDGYSGTHLYGSDGAIKGHFGWANTSAGSLADKMYFGSIAAKDVVFTSNDAERMRITSGGNVGIGTSSPDYKLTVSGGPIKVTDGTRDIFVNPGADFGAGSLPTIQVPTNHALQFATNNSLRMTITSAGYLLCLGVYNLTGAAVANVCVNSNGDIFRAVSSKKYKREITNYSKGLNELLQLRPVSYKSKAEMDGENVFAGLIAEEVHDLGLTEFVQYAKDGSPDALSYSNMVSLLIKSIQEQQAQIEELKAKIK
jgi:hypothetical protein